MYFHVVLPCEHEKAGLLRAVLQASDTSSIEGGPPFSAEPHGWGISMSGSGEFQRARSTERSCATNHTAEAVRGSPEPHSVGGSRPRVAGWPEARPEPPDSRLDTSGPDPGFDPWVGL